MAVSSFISRSTQAIQPAHEWLAHDIDCSYLDHGLLLFGNEREFASKINLRSRQLRNTGQTPSRIDWKRDIQVN